MENVQKLKGHRVLCYDVDPVFLFCNLWLEVLGIVKFPWTIFRWLYFVYY